MPERKRRAPKGKDEVCEKQKPDNVSNESVIHSLKRSLVDIIWKYF